MSSETTQEELVLLSECKRRIHNANFSYAQLREWISVGVPCNSGQRIFLRRADLPGGLATSRQRLEEFVAAINANGGRFSRRGLNGSAKQKSAENQANSETIGETQ